MAAFRCPQCGKPLPRPAGQPKARKVYTPRLDGFERFLRQAVGLPADVPGGDNGAPVNIPRRDPKR
jgi:hypothetical protein